MSFGTTLSKLDLSKGKKNNFYAAQNAFDSQKKSIIAEYTAYTTTEFLGHDEGKKIETLRLKS